MSHCRKRSLKKLLPYCQPYSTYGSSENLVLDQLVTPYWYFSLFSSLIWLILYWYCKEKFCLGHSCELKGKIKRCIFEEVEMLMLTWNDLWCYFAWVTWLTFCFTNRAEYFTCLWGNCILQDWAAESKEDTKKQTRYRNIVNNTCYLYLNRNCVRPFWLLWCFIHSQFCFPPVNFEILNRKLHRET